MSEKVSEPLDAELLEILVCPETKATLVQVGSRLVSTDPDSRRAYRVEDGIPRMLIEESEQLSAADWAQFMRESGHAELVK